MDRRFKVSSINLKSRPVKLLVWAVFILILLVLLISRLGSSSASKSSQSSGSSQVDISEAKASMNIQKEFQFPLKDDAGKEQGTIKFVVDNAELRDQIVVQGKKASAVSGKTFLVINLKITNSSNNTIGMTTRDYVRLEINGNNSELLAPDIHNDPVVVQAISTKNTRVGFPVNENDKNLKLIIGEIQGEKTTIDLNF